MNKTQYQQARHLVRNHGAIALRWIEQAYRPIMAALLLPPQDKLAERAERVEFCHRTGLPYTPATLARDRFGR